VSPGEPVKQGPGALTVIGGVIKGAFVDNLRLKFVALVLSVTLFILVNSDKDAVIGAHIGVSYTMPEDKVLVSEPVDQVRITVKGSWRRIKRFDEREVGNIHVDLTNFVSGEYQFQEDELRLPDGLELLSINPPSIRVTFESRAEKSVPITIPTTGTPPRGYKVDRIVANPSHVVVRGAESVVAAISGVRTREINLDRRTKSFTETPALVKPEAYLEIVDTNAVEVDVRLIEELVMRELGNMPVGIVAGSTLPGVTADRFVTEPAEVKVVVRGSVLAVERVGENVVPIVRVFAEDLAPGTARERDVAVLDAPDGVSFELIPRRVTVRTLAK
jgi:YbbR domain-containing protein